MILLVADMNEIKGNPTAVPTGVIIEARLDKGMGPIGSLIVKRGKHKSRGFFRDRRWIWQNKVHKR